MNRRGFFASLAALAGCLIPAVACAKAKMKSKTIVVSGGVMKHLAPYYDDILVIGSDKNLYFVDGVNKTFYFADGVTHRYVVDPKTGLYTRFVINSKKGK